MCRPCHDKKQCDICKSDVKHDVDKSIYCFRCGSLFCNLCAKLTYAETKKLNSSEQVYFCYACSHDYYCLVCKQLCNHGCIMCNKYQSWIHFKCTKMTKKQINRFSRSDDKYYCTPCISANLPFCQLGSKKLSTLNSNDKVVLPKNNKPWSPPVDDPQNSTCNLCMECNLECTGCSNNTCIDTQRICDTCCNCKYADIDQYNKNNANFRIWYKSSLSIMHVNARSLTKNLSKITDILHSLDSPLDMFLISETKLIEGSDSGWNEEAIRKVNIPGYKFYPTFTNMLFGGTGIYIAEGLNCSGRDDLNLQCEGCESTFLEIPTPGKQKNIIVGAIYRQPHDNHEYFFSSFYSTMEKISPKYSVILLGDINIDVSPKVKCNHVVDYKNVLFSLGL